MNRSTSDLMRMLDNRSDKTTLLWNAGRHRIARSEEVNACAKQAKEITNDAPRPVSYTAVSALIHRTHMDAPSSQCRTKEVYIWTFVWLATTTSRFSKHAVMQSRKHPISVLLLRVIVRRTHFVTSHTMVVTSRFICHIVFASIFFAFYCSNGVLCKGNHNLHNDYISLDQTALAGATAAVFCAFEPVFCSSILAACMDFCWLFSIGGELTTAKDLQNFTYYALTCQVVSIFLHLLYCFNDTVLHMRSFMHLYFPRR